MASLRDKAGRPVVAVTGMGIVTSLGAGTDENWTKLTGGQSGIRSVQRFSTEAMKTRIAGTVDFVPVEPFNAPALTERLGEMAGEEAVAQAKIGGRGRFPGPLFLAVPPIEIEWPQRTELAIASGANDQIHYDDLLRAAATGRYQRYYDRFVFGSVGTHLADKFGTQGMPISLTTACASGASAIQLGLEAIRRGETEAALCIATDGTVNPENLIRFSLLSALSTANDPPEAAAKPFSKNRDGFVMAEGAGAVVLESYEAARARGAPILGIIEGCGELADSFHRTRTSPDGKPIIGCMRNAIADAGLEPAAQLLVARQVAEIGAVPFARVHHQHLPGARRGKHFSDGRDRLSEQRDVVAEGLAEAAGVHEIALHVDDEQRAAARLELELVGLGLDRCHDPSSKSDNACCGLLYAGA